MPTRISKSGLNHRSQGFSLVELLVVVAVIGILAFIAIPLLTVQLGEAEDVRAKRNAQTIASVAASAQAAGNISIEQSTDLETAIAEVQAGVSGRGPFSEIMFTVPNLTPETITQAKSYLELDNGRIVYQGEQ